MWVGGWAGARARYMFIMFTSHQSRVYNNPYEWVCSGVIAPSHESDIIIIITVITIVVAVVHYNGARLDSPAAGRRRRIAYLYRGSYTDIVIVSTSQRGGVNTLYIRRCSLIGAQTSYVLLLLLLLAYSNNTTTPSPSTIRPSDRHDPSASRGPGASTPFYNTHYIIILPTVLLLSTTV